MSKKIKLQLELDKKQALLFESILEIDGITIEKQMKQLYDELETELNPEEKKNVETYISALHNQHALVVEIHKHLKKANEKFESRIITKD
jgi:hypothetical protein